MSLVIQLVRHGESMGNVGQVKSAEIGDHTIELTSRGHQQAREAGARMGPEFLRQALIYCSPFRRARQTLEGLLDGAQVPRDSVRVFEDPRLREVEHGYSDVDDQEELRQTHGWFYYRFSGGESPADCYDRSSSFLESLMRQVERKKASKAVVVTHSLTIRCFVMRFLHLTVEQFDSMSGIGNCKVITLAAKTDLTDPVFTSGKWGVVGLKARS